jgi:uncharacterized membrane protein
MPIRHPLEWGLHQLQFADAGEVLEPSIHDPHTVPAVRTIDLEDLRVALVQGWADFSQCRTDVLFLCILYPLVGLLLGRLAFGYGVLPLLFPLAGGFALVGPLAALGLYEISRRREGGAEVSWLDAFGVLRTRAIGAVIQFGLVLTAIFTVWLVVAALIYRATLGPTPPASLGAFIDALFGTDGGGALIVFGCGTGFLFAGLVLTITIVSFPLMLDRGASLETAVATSIKVVRTNPFPIAMWGALVATLLILGALPGLIGLAIVLPVLGHATWHLYRRLI